MKRFAFLVLLMLMSTFSFAEEAEGETVYSIPEGQLDTALADGKLTLEEFGVEDILDTRQGSIYLMLPKDLDKYTDLSKPVTVVTIPERIDIEINDVRVRGFDCFVGRCKLQYTSFDSGNLKLGELNSFKYTPRLERDFKKESYLQFQPLLEIEASVPPNPVLNQEVTIPVKISNIGKSVAEELSISVSPQNAQASTDPIKQQLNPGESYSYEIKMTPTSVGEVNLGSVSASTGASVDLGAHIVSEASSRIDYSIRPTKSYFEAGETPTFEVNFRNRGPYPVKNVELKLWRSTDIKSWKLGDLLYADEEIKKDIEMSALKEVEGKTRFTAKLSYTTDQQLNPTEVEDAIWVDMVGDRIQITVEGQTAVEGGPAAGVPAKEEGVTEPQQPKGEEKQPAQSPSGGSNALVYLIIIALVAVIGYLFMQQQKLMKKLDEK